MLKYPFSTTTQLFILQPYSPLTRRLAGKFPHQSSSFYPISHIYLIQPTLSLISLSTIWFSVILGLPLPLTPSTSYSMLLFTQSSSSFSTACPSHWFLFTTSITSSIPILFLRSKLGTLSFNNVPYIHGPNLTSISHHSSHITYTFPLNFNSISYLVKIPDSSLNTSKHNALLPLIVSWLLYLHSAYPPGNRSSLLLQDECHFPDPCFPVCWYFLHRLLPHIPCRQMHPPLSEPFTPEQCLWTHLPHPLHCTELFFTVVSIYVKLYDFRNCRLQRDAHDIHRYQLWFVWPLVHGCYPLVFLFSSTEYIKCFVHFWMAVVVYPRCDPSCY